MTTTYPLPEPYNDNTPQDHADALRDYADLRMGGPLLDYLALAGAELIEQQAAEVGRLKSLVGEPCQHGLYQFQGCGPCSFDRAVAR